ncbi:hypothetical protein C2G38_2037892 [Gigaspora rosea]|uniref:Uncharacterized protein n=1 Tax=Gigaspora rosea TaxID=44941 RepID=A0A397V6J2_9GLOM|nr:hypothetical protein C2G38_2037892 [Gigaspora rosea]
METMELLLQIEKQKEEIIELTKMINEYCDEIIRLRESYQKKCKENDELIKQWNSRHNDQYKCIEEVINIIQRERECLYEEIESLIRDNNRFSLKNLLNYDPQTWLMMQEAINQELYTYLNEILELLCEEKLSAANEIDSFIANTGLSSHCNKRYTSCGKQNIENRKQVCPNCRVHLPALLELPKQGILELDKGDREQATIFKPYLVEKN